MKKQTESLNTIYNEQGDIICIIKRNEGIAERQGKVSIYKVEPMSCEELSNLIVPE